MQTGRSDRALETPPRRCAACLRTSAPTAPRRRRPAAGVLPCLLRRSAESVDCKGDLGRSAPGSGSVRRPTLETRRTRGEAGGGRFGRLCRFNADAARWACAGPSHAAANPPRETDDDTRQARCGALSPGRAGCVHAVRFEAPSTWIGGLLRRLAVWSRRDGRQRIRPTRDPSSTGSGPRFTTAPRPPRRACPQARRRDSHRRTAKARRRPAPGSRYCLRPGSGAPRRPAARRRQGRANTSG